MKTRLILVVEDEADIRELLRYSLGSADYAVQTAATAQEAARIIKTQLPDLILLDWMLPGMSGLAYAKQLKSQQRTRDIPLIMLTAKAEEDHKVKGLEVGADDYITKPFSPRELLARIKSVLRRGPFLGDEAVVQVNDLVLEQQKHQVKIHDQVLHLSPNAFKLLEFLILHPNRVYSREQLLDQVWGQDTYVEDRAVDVQIKRLRTVLRSHQYDHYIQTIRGAGYKFAIPEGSTND